MKDISNQYYVLGTWEVLIMGNEKNITNKLKDLAKKRKRTIVVVKAGSAKHVRRSSGGDFGEYFPSYSED